MCYLLSPKTPVIFKMEKQRLKEKKNGFPNSIHSVGDGAAS